MSWTHDEAFLYIYNLISCVLLFLIGWKNTYFSRAQATSEEEGEVTSFSSGVRKKWNLGREKWVPCCCKDMSWLVKSTFIISCLFVSPLTILFNIYDVVSLLFIFNCTFCVNTAFLSSLFPNILPWNIFLLSVWLKGKIFHWKSIWMLVIFILIKGQDFNLWNN